jgi:hypothetical protein
MKAAANRPQSRRTPVATVAKADGWGTPALWLLLALLTFAWVLPVRAGELDVIAGAAYPDPTTTGCGGIGCGLRVTPGTTCTALDDELFITTPTVSGDRVACDRIIAGTTPGGVATSGDTTFTAGDEIVLRENFTVAHSFAAIISSPLTQWAYVQDNSPAAEKSYNASFYLKLNNLTFGNTTDRLHHFVGYSNDGTPWFRVVLRKNEADKRLVLEAREDGGSWVSTTDTNDELMLPAGYNQVEIRWSAGSGDFQASINGGAFNDGLSGLDNDMAQIDYIKWGAVGTHTSIDAITGTLDIDEFSSWR